MGFRLLAVGRAGEGGRGRRVRREGQSEVGGHTFEDPYGGGEIVNSSRCFEGGGDDRGGGDKIVGESVI